MGPWELIVAATIRIASLAPILIVFFVLMYQMRSQNRKLDAKIEAQGAEMRAEFRSLRESLETRLDLDSRLRTVEREQAASGRRASETSTED